MTAVENTGEKVFGVSHLRVSRASFAAPIIAAAPPPTRRPGLIRASAAPRTRLDHAPELEMDSECTETRVFGRSGSIGGEAA